MVSDLDSDDAKRFEKFLDAMEDTEFDYWYDNEASGKQKDLADQLRESASPDDANDYVNVHRDALRSFYGSFL